MSIDFIKDVGDGIGKKIGEYLVTAIAAICLAAFAWIKRRSLFSFKRDSRHSSTAPILQSNIQSESEPLLDELSFHVLKAYMRFPNGCMGVNGVAYYCQIERDEALRCVQALHSKKYIQTKVVGVGEWNGEYGITAKGVLYVKEHAT